MAAASGNNHCDGVFLPKGAVHLLGPQTYANVLQENEVFLSNVATIPMNLEYAAWFAVIDPTNQSETEPISLHDHLLLKSWFLRIEPVARTKCFLVTTQSTLNEARTWIDEHLERLVCKSIPPGSDPPPSHLPRCLDKPMHTKTGLSYADILKKQCSLAPNPEMTDTRNNHPPRKRQATIINYNLDTSSDMPQTTTVDNPTSTSTISTTSTNTATPHHPPTPTAHNDYATELQALQSEINELKKNAYHSSRTI